MIQRAIEASGIPTVAIVNLPERAEWLRLPRAVAVRFPRGATVGAPGDAGQQRRVLLAALERLAGQEAPAPPLVLDERWRPTRRTAP